MDLEMTKKIVLTTGTYNLIHPGHIKLLEAAARLGDELHIFLDSDKRNKELKGEKAIFSWVDRKKVLESLKVVSVVHHYEGPNGDFANKLRLLANDYHHTKKENRNKLIFIKGGDYSFKKMNQDEISLVKQNGGIVALLEYDDQYSTTKIFEKISGNGKIYE